MPRGDENAGVAKGQLGRACDRDPILSEGEDYALGERPNPSAR
jgi:hypothetical protein